MTKSGDCMELTCIVCPNGCRLTVDGEGGDLKVTGAQCKKGTAFAEAELTNPVRSLTTTVPTVFPDFPRLPVKINGEIPKNRIFDAMKVIKTALVTSRLRVGDIVLPDVCGVELVATANMNTI